MFGLGFSFIFFLVSKSSRSSPRRRRRIENIKGWVQEFKNLIAKRQKNSILFYPPRWFSESVSLSFYTDFLFSTFDCHFSIVPSSFFYLGGGNFLFSYIKSVIIIFFKILFMFAMQLLLLIKNRNQLKETEVGGIICVLLLGLFWLEARLN